MYHLIPKYNNACRGRMTFAEVCGSAEANLNTHLSKGSSINAEK